MTRILRPGVPASAYFSNPISEAPKPVPTPAQIATRLSPQRTTRISHAVRHDHGSRRHRLYERTTEREAIAESMGTYLAPSTRRTITSLSATLSAFEPAKRGPRVTAERRMAIRDLATLIGLTSAQTLLLVNKHFGEYAKTASSTVATIVASEVQKWCESAEAETVLDAIRNGEF